MSDSIIKPNCSNEGCTRPAFTKSGLCRGCNLKAGRARSKDAKPVTSNLKDAYDRKLDHFQYTKDENELQIWESDQTLSPLNVPADLKKKYPDIRWRWVSNKKLDRVGSGYQGWQLFKDSKHPEGVKRGGDLRLAAMPEDMARKYNAHTMSESNRRMQGLSELDLERGASALRQQGHEVEYTGHGISLDKNARRPVRGLHPEEVKERAAKAREERAKGRVFFT